METKTFQLIRCKIILAEKVLEKNAASSFTQKLVFFSLCNFLVCFQILQGFQLVCIIRQLQSKRNKDKRFFV